MRLVDADRLMSLITIPEIQKIIENQPTIYPAFTGGRCTGKTVVSEYVAICSMLKNSGWDTSNPVGAVGQILEEIEKLRENKEVVE